MRVPLDAHRRRKFVIRVPELQNDVELAEQCACKFTDTCTTCSNEETRSKRQEIKNLIRDMKSRNPDVEAHIFRSVENVCLDTVIAYKQKGQKISFLDHYDDPRNESPEK